MFNPVNWLRLKKWGTLATLAITPLIPIASFKFLFGVPLVYGNMYYGSLLAYNGIKYLLDSNFFRFTLDPLTKRAYSSRNKTEKEIAKILQDLATKANIPVPQLTVAKVLSRKDLHVSAEVKDWPFTAEVIISQAAIDLFREKKLSRPTLLSMLAHEIAHIKNNHRIFHILNLLLNRNAKSHFSLSCMVSFLLYVIVATNYRGNPLPEAILAFFSYPSNLIPLLALPLIAKSHEVITKLLTRSFERTDEFLADFGEVELTGDPQAGMLVLDEICFHEMNWGRVLIEGAKGEKIPLDDLDPALSPQKLYAKLMKEQHPTPGIWHEQLAKDWSKQKALYEKSLSYVWKSWNAKHPSDFERKEMIKACFPHAVQNESAASDLVTTIRNNRQSKMKTA